MIIALDCETTGIDFRHGARPFFVSTCDEDGEQRYWEWPVDPITREVRPPQSDLDEINEVIATADVVVGHNLKFDLHALASVDPSYAESWDWDRTDDTILMAHLLASNHPKNLTDLTSQWLGHDLSPLEDRLETQVKAARALARRADFVEERGEWALAKEGRADMPSAKGECWRYDYWLPKEVHDRHDGAPGEFATELRDYALADTAATIALRGVLLAKLRERGLVKHYRHRVEQLAVVHEMETRGVTVIRSNAKMLRTTYERKSAELDAECREIATARGYDLTLPKNGVNASLRGFMFDVLKVPEVRSAKAKTDAPTLNKEVMAFYQSTLPEGDSLRFVRALARKRKLDTSIGYLDSYRSFFRPEGTGYARIHPSINLTGTATLRTTSANPNEQQISKQKDDEGHSLRSMFGPLPGREWWSMDYENIELRIPAYLADEREMIALFESPDEPPYFGSNHLLVAHILWPREFEECLRSGESFKDKYKSTLYQWTKNGNFAVQYGAVEQSGTADRAYHQVGAQAKIKRRFSKIAKLNEDTIAFARRRGYVETVPDREIDPTRGYPLLVSRTGYGDVEPTVPLNYKIQGTAMQCTLKAKVRCHRLISNWNSSLPDADHTSIALQVHDEMVFDLPEGGKRNLDKIEALKTSMEKSGDDIGIPLRVSVSYHPNNWAEEETP